MTTLQGFTVRDSAGVRGEILDVSAPWIRVGWWDEGAKAPREESLLQTDPRVERMEVLTLEGGWVPLTESISEDFQPFYLYLIHHASDQEVWLLAQSQLKNGGYKGLQVVHWKDRKKPDKAVQKTTGPAGGGPLTGSPSAWKRVSKSEVPPAVLARFSEKSVSLPEDLESLIEGAGSKLRSPFKRAGSIGPGPRHGWGKRRGGSKHKKRDYWDCSASGKYTYSCKGKEGENKTVKVDPEYKSDYNKLYKAWHRARLRYSAPNLMIKKGKGMKKSKKK